MRSRAHLACKLQCVLFWHFHLAQHKSVLWARLTSVPVDVQQHHLHILQCPKSAYVRTMISCYLCSVTFCNSTLCYATSLKIQKARVFQNGLEVCKSAAAMSLWAAVFEISRKTSILVDFEIVGQFVARSDARDKRQNRCRIKNSKFNGQEILELVTEW